MIDIFAPTIERLEGAIRYNELMIAEARRTLADQDAAIATLRQQIVEAEDAIASHERAIAILKAQT